MVNITENFQTNVLCYEEKIGETTSIIDIYPKTVASNVNDKDDKTVQAHINDNERHLTSSQVNEFTKDKL